MDTTLAPIPSHTVTPGLGPGSPISSTSDGRTWIDADEQENAELNRRYKLTLQVKAPYTVENIEKLEDALRLGVGVKNVAQWATLQQSITIESFNATYPRTNGATGTPIWTFSMVFKKTGGGTPLLIIIGAVALVVTLTILASVVGHTIEKEADKVKDLGQATVFNPWFLVAAVIVVLAFTGRSLTNIAKS